MDEHCTDLDACGINRAIARVNENEHCESCCNNSSKHDNVIKKIRYIGVDFDDAKIKNVKMTLIMHYYRVINHLNVLIHHVV